MQHNKIVSILCNNVQYCAIMCNIALISRNCFFIHRIFSSLIDFIADVDKLKDGDDLKWQALDILSLKLQRIIAVRWPYDGYLGRIGM